MLDLNQFRKYLATRWNTKTLPDYLVIMRMPCEEVFTYVSDVSTIIQNMTLTNPDHVIYGRELWNLKGNGYTKKNKHRLYAYLSGILVSDLKNAKMIPRLIDAGHLCFVTVMNDSYSAFKQRGFERRGGTCFLGAEDNSSVLYVQCCLNKDWADTSIHGFKFADMK